MRRNKAEDQGIKGMLQDEYNRCLDLMDQIKRSIGQYPKGRLVVKKVKAKGRVYEYHHLQWREGKKVRSQHVPENKIPELKEKIEQREAYQKNGIKIEKRLEYLAPLIGEKKPLRRGWGLKVNVSSIDRKKTKKDEKPPGSLLVPERLKKIKSK